MKKAQKIIFSLFILFIANTSLAQFSKSSCEDLLKNIDVKSFQKLKIVTKSASDNLSNITIQFDVESAKFFYNEDFLTLKDASGLTIYVPYNMIKLIKTAPKSGSEYSNITILLAD